MAAVSALRESYGDRIQFEIEEARSAEELMDRHMGALKHGLMVFGSDGELVHVEPGHNFGKERIIEIIREKLET